MKKSVYLFVGDSLTEGRYGESWVQRVAQALDAGQPGAVEVINAGRGNETAQSLQDRFGGLLERHQPEWVILAVGGNDVWLPWLSEHSLGWKLWFQYRGLRWGQRPIADLDRFAAAYRALIDEARAVAGAGVVACTASPLGERISSPVNRRLARLNGVIKHVAVDRRAPVADVWQVFVEQLAPLPDPSAYIAGEWLFAWLDRYRLRSVTPNEVSRRRRLHYTFDGIHLNSQGADLWAGTVLRTLARVQKGGFR